MSEGTLPGALNIQCRVVITILFPVLLLLGDFLSDGNHVSFTSLPLQCMAHVNAHLHKSDFQFGNSQSIQGPNE